MTTETEKSPREIAEDISRRGLPLSAFIDPSEYQDVYSWMANGIEKALRDRDERAAKIAESHFENHLGDSAKGGLIHEGQCHQAIASAIRGKS